MRTDESPEQFGERLARESWERIGPATVTALRNAEAIDRLNSALRNAEALRLDSAHMRHSPRKPTLRIIQGGRADG